MSQVRVDGLECEGRGPAMAVEWGAQLFVDLEATAETGLQRPEGL